MLLAAFHGGIPFGGIPCKFREPKRLDFEAAKVEILKGVDKCIKTYCERHHLDEVILRAWRVEIVKAIDERIQEIVPTLKVGHVLETLKDPFCRQTLLDLQERFVITPIDKATGNIALICKRFYAEVLVKELGLNGTGSDLSLIHI